MNLRETAEQDASAPATAQGGAALPAKRLVGRSVMVLLGASEPALALLSHALHALGVDTLESADDEAANAGGAEWRRPWISAFNSRLLQAIDRAPEHPAHALPFPPGWWRKPAVQAIKRQITAELETALADQAEPWGFADLATARLLPVWQDVLEQLGLNPVYVWSLTHPSGAPAAGSESPARDAAAAAEVRWFAYGADIYRYAGEHLACVVDERDWRSDPQDLMQRLVDRLHLRWRGTRLDLYETVSGVLAQAIDMTPAERPHPASFPLSMAFYESAARLDEDPQARSRLASMVESAELLRPMISPFLSAFQQPAPADADGQAEEAATLRQEILALRETCGELRRRAEAAEQAQPPVAPSGAAEDSQDAAVLRMELEARVAETRWLHDQYATRLSAAQSEIEDLRRELGSAGSGEVGGANAQTELAEAKAEIARLQTEMVTLTNANERYLSRIYELKKLLEDQGAFEGVGR